MRKRVAAIIVENNDVILLYRKKNQQTYYVFPGGGVEENETEEQALIREVFEELGLVISVKNEFHRAVYNVPLINEQEEAFYFCEILSGIPGTGTGSEFQLNDENNIYRVESVSFNTLIDKNLIPEDMKTKLLSWYFLKIKKDKH
jgi:8-oxo-dGTP diphosphatase